ncbi:tetratricopeptide repeat protein [Zoogloea sp.]|uniref:tetratricopeptide repeat protein n=1 Tax=Zoogloea sp. TaxID=49181 RepID=UPI0035B44A90
MKRGGWLACVCITFLLSCAAGAASTSPANSDERRYRDALSALENQDPDSAMTQLESLITDLPDHAGAWLDLAILVCQSGAQNRAEELFRHIEERFSPPPAIREVITRYRNTGCPKPHPNKLRGQLSVSLGRDTNATLGVPYGQVLLGPTGNTFEVQVAANQRSKDSIVAGLEGELSIPVGPYGTTLFGYLSGRRFPSAASFDTSTWAAAVTQPVPWRTGQASLLSAGLVHSRMDGKSFQNSAYLNWIEPLSMRGDDMEWALDLSGVQNRYEVNRAFDSRVLEIRLQHSGKLGAGRYVLGAGRVQDNAEANRPGGDREGWSMQLNLAYPMAHGSRLEVFMREQRLKGSEEYAPGIISTHRASVTRQSRITYAHPVSSQEEWRVQARRLENHDNIPLFEYTSNALEGVWSYSWR